MMELKRAVYSSPGAAGVKGFEDLECYKFALDIMVNAHEVAKIFPSEEKYDLVQQLRRSAKSVPANIAEGYGRYHYLDSLKFYSNARGSLNETLSHFIAARALNYIEQPYFEALYKLTRRTERALNGYMNYVRNQKTGQDLYGSKLLSEESVDYLKDNTTYP
jgi:four helix bundle protein